MYFLPYFVAWKSSLVLATVGGGEKPQPKKQRQKYNSFPEEEK